MTKYACVVCWENCRTDCIYCDVSDYILNQYCKFHFHDNNSEIIKLTHVICGRLKTK